MKEIIYHTESFGFPPPDAILRDKPVGALARAVEAARCNG
jgi:hypothetical protein